MRVLKIVCGTWENASRDKRELAVCRELGCDVAVMAKGNPGDDGRKDNESGFDVYRFSTRPLGTASWLNPLNRALSLWIWGRKAARFEANIISGHDLTGLLIGYLCNIGRRHKAKLVYDSHEFELGRNTNRGAFFTWCTGRLEKFLMKRCAFSMMVNDSIADEVQRIHHLAVRPVVVRNIPTYWTLNAEKTAETRQEFLTALHVPTDTFLVMFHGLIAPNRAIEQMLQAVAKLPGTAAVVLGNGEPEYINSLRALTENLGIANRTLFHPAVPLEILRNYVSAADLGVSIDLVGCKSYYFSLPNKFFECIQSLTPLLISDLPEEARILDYYHLGLKTPPGDLDAVTAAIEKLKTDHALYAQCKAGLVKAKEDLCWENEKTVLVAAYQSLF